jgi:hypothetical protein
MEFKTSQGGTTTLVFDEGEMLQLESIAKRQECSIGDVIDLIAKQRQANPLADFDGLLLKTFPNIYAAGLVPAKRQKQQKAPDPLVDLENLIRRRISAQQLPTGPTSQSHQAEATLLNALATCLLAQTMRDRDAG